MPEIEIRNLSKSFNGKKVLDDVSLSVEKGDVFGVLGLSGAGKSTLVRCINGLEIPDGGKSSIAAKPYARQPKGSRRRSAGKSR